MSGVLAETDGRGDILLLRGITNRLAVRWQRDSGSGFQPVDLTDYVCTFELRPPGSGDVAYSRACDAHGIDGIAAVYIPPDAFTATAWATRRSGEWRMTASNGGTTELLGWGYWTLAN
jgi:hypothetical protein